MMSIPHCHKVDASKESVKLDSNPNVSLVHSVKTTTMETQANTFYRKPLPIGCFTHESPEGRQIFKEALTSGYMECYFPLSSQFHTQSDPAFCGLGTLTMVLNALNVDPQVVWKGIWRWYSEDLLNCCSPLEEVQKKGITFEEFMCLGRCNGANIIGKRPRDSSLEEFRQLVKKVTQTPSGEFLVVSYDRKGLSQTGSGHYSPIGGYHPEKDLVFIMDVARFKYPPHWVSLPTLWEAMKPIDPETGQSRGFFTLTPGKVSLFCRLTSGSHLWNAVVENLKSKLPKQLLVSSPKNPKEVVQVFLKIFSENFFIETFKTYQDNLSHLSEAHTNFLTKLSEEIQKHPIYAVVKDVLDKPWNIDLVCVIILTTNLESHMIPDLGREWAELVRVEKGSSLEGEVKLLSDSLKNIESVCCKATS